MWRTKEHSAKITLEAPGVYRGNGGQRIDLCTKCYEEFVNFLEKGANE